MLRLISTRTTKSRSDDHQIGRIQSREYMKKLDEEHMERRVAYEVSVSKLEVAKEAIEQKKGKFLNENQSIY